MSKEKQGLTALASTPVELDFNGRKLKFSPLTLSDFGVLENYVKSQRLQTILESYRLMGDLSLQEQSEKEKIMRAVTTASLEPVDFVQAMVSVRGSMYMIWLSAKKEHPEMTMDELSSFVTSHEDVIKIVQQISGLDVDGGADSTDPPASSEQAGTK